MKTAADRSHSRSALLIVDVINAFDYDGAPGLVRATRKIVPRIVALREAYSRAGFPVVYCNDNFGQWRSDFRTVVDACAMEGTRGADIVARLRPREDDYFVLKPKHSAFFATPLDLLLRSLRVRAIDVCGIAGDGCVLLTAADAHLRDYEATVVADAVASETPARNRRALEHLRESETAYVVTTATVVRRIARKRARN